MRFSGKVGFGLSVEASPGKWVDHIVERPYQGDVVRTGRAASDGDKVVPDISVQNSVSILADAFVSQNFMTIRYVEWQGVRWKVSEVEIQRPRLLLRLGEVYVGPDPS